MTEMKRIKLMSKLFEERKKLIETMGAPIVLLFLVVLLIITGSTINANTTSEKQSSVASGISSSSTNPLSAISNQKAPFAPAPLALQASAPASLAIGATDIGLPQATTQTSTIISSQLSQAQQQQQASDVTSSAPKSGQQQQQQLGATSDGGGGDDEGDSMAAGQSGVESAQAISGSHYSQSSQSLSSMMNSIGQQAPGSIMSASSSSSSVQAQAASPAASSVYPPRLPKINIYANKDEVMKLLGKFSANFLPIFCLLFSVLWPQMSTICRRLSRAT